MDKKPNFGDSVSQFLVNIFIACIAACISACAIAVTVRFITWLF